MSWTNINFGKYKGKTLPQIIFADPDWFFWACEKDVFRDRPSLAHEAQDIYRKARRIRIPQSGGETLVAEYYLDPSNKLLADVRIVSESRREHTGSSPTQRLSVIDLAFTRQQKEHDKQGGKILISRLKQIVFGNQRYRLTKEKCEEFFSDNSNFDL